MDLHNDESRDARRCETVSRLVETQMRLLSFKSIRPWRHARLISDAEWYDIVQSWLSLRDFVRAD